MHIHTVSTLYIESLVPVIEISSMCLAKAAWVVSGPSVATVTVTVLMLQH